MDEVTFEKTEHFERLRTQPDGLVADLAAFAAQQAQVGTGGRTPEPA